MIDGLIERLEAMLRDASPLPWQIDKNGAEMDANRDPILNQDGNFERYSDAPFVIASVNALPKLLRVAKAAETASKKWMDNAMCVYEMYALQDALADMAQEDAGMEETS